MNRATLTTTQKQILWLAAIAVILIRVQFTIQGFPIPVTLAIVPAAMVALAVFGRARIDPVAALLLIGICELGCLSFLINGQRSAPSLFLIVYLYVVTIFVVEVNCAQQRAFERSTIVLGVVISILGIAQFFLQWVLPAEYLFSWRKLLPPSVLVEYNSLNELYYEAGVFKSNGVFFLESSHFGIFISRIFALSILSGGLPAAAALAASTVLSYSGTAWLILAIFLFCYIIAAIFGKVRMPRWLLFFVIFAGIGVVIAAPFLQLDRYMSRAGELQSGSVQSSGGQRFNVPFDLTMKFLREADATKMLIGSGPGMVDTYFGIRRYAVVASPWSKLIIEYGLVGFMLFSALLYRIVSRATRNRALQASIVIGFMFIDPGLLLASAVYPLYLLFGCVAIRKN
jgi:hypothetical protein